MAVDVEKLVVQLSADIKGFQNAMSKAQGVTTQRARAIESRFLSMNKRVAAGYQGLAANAAKAFALIGGAQGFRQLSDSGTRITNSLKVAGLAGEELENVYQKLLKSAQANAAPLETLVELYGKVALVQGELGVSSNDIVGFANNIGVALRASGKSSEAASGAILQLTQSLGAGIVRAEEFSSIQEGAPTILQAAANGIKQAEGSVAKLRNIMLAGNLSSKAFFDGINAGTPVIEKKLGDSVLTIDQRFENLRTSLTNATRKFNESSQAANTFGGAIDNMSQFVNSVDMDGLASDIGKIVGVLNQGSTAAQNFGTELGNISGLAKIGQGIVDSYGENGKISFLGGALTIESTLRTEDKLTDLAEERLAVEKKIDELKSNPVWAQSGLQEYETRLDEINKKAAGMAETIKGGPLVYDRFKPPTASSVGSGAKFTPIDITDPKYKVDGKEKKKKKTRENEYAREVEQIQKRTTALQAETAAQAGLNPLINDYGYAVEFARAKQDLLTAAQEAGVKITPELKASIEQLASGYANAVVASEKLAEKQDEIRQRAEEAMATAKDVTRGIIDGFIEGASAADILSDSLKKIGNALLDDVLNSIFKINNAAGGGGFLSSIFGGIFGGGGGFGSNYFPPAPKKFDDGGSTGSISFSNIPEVLA